MVYYIDIIHNSDFEDAETYLYYLKTYINENYEIMRRDYNDSKIFATSYY